MRHTLDEVKEFRKILLEKPRLDLTALLETFQDNVFHWKIILALSRLPVNKNKIGRTIPTSVWLGRDLTWDLQCGLGPVMPD